MGKGITRDWVWGRKRGKRKEKRESGNGRGEKVKETALIREETVSLKGRNPVEYGGKWLPTPPLILN